MGFLTEKDHRLFEEARRRAVEDEVGTDSSDRRTIDVDRDPAPELPKLITLPRDVVLTTLREVQEFSFRRALWGQRRKARGSAPDDSL